MLDGWESAHTVPYCVFLIDRNRMGCLAVAPLALHVQVYSSRGTRTLVLYLYTLVLALRRVDVAGGWTERLA